MILRKIIFFGLKKITEQNKNMLENWKSQMFINQFMVESYDLKETYIRNFDLINA